MRQFAVIGLGRFGFKVAEILAKKGAEVIAIDKNPILVEKVKDIVTEALQLDSTDEEALRASGVQDVDVAVVCIGEDVESNVLTTTLLQNFGIQEIVSRASSRLHAQILQAVGATRVVFPEEDMGLRVANSILEPGVLEYIELGADYNLAEIEVKGDFIGKTLKELHIKSRYRVNVIMIMEKVKQESDKEGVFFEKEMKKLPTPDYVLREKDLLVVVGDSKDIEMLEKQIE
ncbi:MAG: TrkA family potassium uptake protein [Candidatus Scalindua sp. AMX11]|nr:MAG: TrkA family potassium uptake protein [Candidatus Scalindua sp.]RZV95312.1 MAG: TrkA family potassium uptake protein [Candidatus Scalindua sp. SCAELEC01]TDE66205.1 MAG: TrkA family potassium uptake protein [Candidatus Scalindua sp. AMX11]GJQ57825.1 MAG: potassium transporter Trk [Candidatus Scalindua sp.]